MKQHPLSKAFPAMTEDEYAATRDDMRTHGQRDYITVHEGMVLDGWHRYLIATELKVAPKLEDLDSRISPAGFVLSRNLHRRHLNASQRAVAVASVAEWQPSGRPEKKGEPGSPFPQSVAEMAEVANVSPRTIQDAKAVVKKGKKAVAKVMAGKASVKSIARPEPEPVIEDEGDGDEKELKNSIDGMLADNARLREENAALAKTDAGAQIAAMNAEIGALRGRINGLLAENKEAVKQAKYYQNICDKLRKILGVEKASGIVAAVEGLKS